LTPAEHRRLIVDTWSAAWSEPDENRRRDDLRRTASAACVYTDPHVALAGHEAISAYMGQFQGSAPGARFVNTGFATHHDHCLLQWDMVDGAGKVISHGASAGVFDADDRLAQMTGFFDS